MDPLAKAKRTKDFDAARKYIAELEGKVGQQQVELDFFSANLAASQGSTPAERRAWRDGVYAIIEALTPPMQQGKLTVDRMCRLAGVSRAGYYRHWATSAPRQEETAIRDAVQRTSLANRRYGYRRIAKELGRNGLVGG